MIEFAGQDGAKVAVNPKTVWYVRSSGTDQSAIHTTSGAALFVNEPYAEVLSRFRSYSRR